MGGWNYSGMPLPGDCAGAVAHLSRADGSRLGGYAVIAHEMLQAGGFFEGELLDQKPPVFTQLTRLLSYWPATGGRRFICSASPPPWRHCSVFISRKKHRRNRSVGLWAAAFWTVTCSDLYLEATSQIPRCSSTHGRYSDSCFCLVAGRERPMIQMAHEVSLSGFSLHVSAFRFLPPGWRASVSPWRALQTCRGGNPFLSSCVHPLPPPCANRRQAVCDIAVVVLSECWRGRDYLAIWHDGRLQNFLRLHNQSKCRLFRHKGSNLIVPQVLILFSRTPSMAAGFGGAALAGTVSAIYRRKYYPWAVLAGLAVGTALAVALPENFFLTITSLVSFLDSRQCAHGGWIGQTAPRFKVAQFLPPLALLALLANEVPFYFLPAWKWSYEKYGPIFVQTDLLARDIRNWLKPGETMFQLGEEPQLYLTPASVQPAPFASTACSHRGRFLLFCQKTCIDLYTIRLIFLLSIG